MKVREEGLEKNNKNNQKTFNKMPITTYLLRTTLDVNGLKCANQKI